MLLNDDEDAIGVSTYSCYMDRFEAFLGSDMELFMTKHFGLLQNSTSMTREWDKKV
jgi:hypothetical protein